MLIILIAGGNSHGPFPNVILFPHESGKYYGNTNIDPELWRIFKNCILYDGQFLHSFFSGKLRVSLSLFFFFLDLEGLQCSRTIQSSIMLYE